MRKPHIRQTVHYLYLVFRQRLQPTMLRNYLKIAYRNFTQQKYYSLINTLGLALGSAACMLILLFVRDELSYEKSFKKNDQIYRLVEEFPMGNHLSKSATIPFP